RMGQVPLPRAAAIGAVTKCRTQVGDDPSPGRDGDREDSNGRKADRNGPNRSIQRGPPGADTRPVQHRRMINSCHIGSLPTPSSVEEAEIDLPLLRDGQTAPLAGIWTASEAAGSA